MENNQNELSVRWPRPSCSSRDVLHEGKRSYSLITYVNGDATQPIGSGRKIIAHITNNSGGWGRGFVVALSKRWSAPERVYRLEVPDLGEVDYAWVEENLWVANMCAQNGYVSREQPVAVDYSALGICLDQVAMRATDLDASVHMPRIGCGLGGGRWETIEALITQRLVANGVKVTVYDL